MSNSMNKKTLLIATIIISISPLCLYRPLVSGIEEKKKELLKEYKKLGSGSAKSGFQINSRCVDRIIQQINTLYQRYQDEEIDPAKITIKQKVLLHIILMGIPTNSFWLSQSAIEVMVWTRIRPFTKETLKQWKTLKAKCYHTKMFVLSMLCSLLKRYAPKKSSHHVQTNKHIQEEIEATLSDFVQDKNDFAREMAGQENKDYNNYDKEREYRDYLECQEWLASLDNDFDDDEFLSDNENRKKEREKTLLDEYFSSSSFDDSISDATESSDHLSSSDSGNIDDLDEAWNKNFPADHPIYQSQHYDEFWTQWKWQRQLTFNNAKKRK